MPDNQIVAIYNHFVRDGVFRKPEKKSRVISNCRQQTLWDDYGIEKYDDKRYGYGLYKYRKPEKKDVSDDDKLFDGPNGEFYDD